MALVLVSVQYDASGAETPYPHLSTFTCRALTGVGAVPLLAPSVPAHALAGHADALLLTGGGDLCPACYAYHVPPERVLGADHARDLYEYALFHAFLERRKPIFGICRGMQLINVWLGGTLSEDLDEGRGTGTHGGGRAHPIETEPDSWLSALVGRGCTVLSFHHQACGELAPGLRGSAYAPDGVCEAFCHERLPVFGVQWHPERMYIPGERDGGGMSGLFAFWNDIAEKHGKNPGIRA